MIKGKISAIHDIQDIPNTEYQKRVFAISNNEGYQGKEQVFAFELFGDKMSLINGFKEGDQVDVEYNLRCRHWKEDKYFTTLDAWKITKVAGEYQPPEAQNHEPQTAPPLPENDNLPF
tara:strand:+ start:408 stop:761 length:354 start_codon:yes stop_codon:yes gene_type:complete